MKNVYIISIISILVVIILLQRECSTNKTTPEIKTITTTRVDTIYKKITDTVIKNVKITKIIKNTDTINKYSYISSCKDKIIYNETIKIDSIGSIVIIDTVQNNVLHQRKYIKEEMTEMIRFSSSKA